MNSSAMQAQMAASGSWRRAFIMTSMIGMLIFGISQAVTNTYPLAPKRPEQMPHKGPSAPCRSCMAKTRSFEKGKGVLRRTSTTSSKRFISVSIIPSKRYRPCTSRRVALSTPMRELRPPQRTTARDFRKPIPFNPMVW